MTTRKATNLIPYTPSDWSAQQRDCHRATTLEDALYKACLLAGGWYRRAVTIDCLVTESNDETYMLRPAETAAGDGWTPCYTITAERS